MPQYVLNNIKVMVQSFGIFTHIAQDQIHSLISYFMTNKP